MRKNAENKPNCAGFVFLDGAIGGLLSMSKVYVVDDDAVRRAHICRLLAQEDIHPEPFDSIDELLQFMPTQGFILVCDQGEGVFELIQRLKRDTWLPIIAYSQAPEISRIVRAMQSGVASYVGYPLNAAEFRREYTKLQTDLATKVAKQQRSAAARKMLETLSNREREILACMLDHGTSKAIGRHLGISPRTVEAHRASLMARLEVRTAAQAIRIAVEGDAFGMTADNSTYRDNVPLGIACDDRYEELVQQVAG